MERAQVTNGNSADTGVVAHPAELAALRYTARRLHLDPVAATGSALAGPHQSPVRGRGLDFEEVRRYQPGDDVRTIDWRVTARTGRTHTKVFHEERERPVWIFFDAGPSMHFGTRCAFKSVAAARAAALMAWSASAAGDRIGALVSSQAGVVWLPPAARERQLMELLAEFARATTARDEASASVAESAADCLGRLPGRVEHGSRVFVVSDFYGFDERWRKPLDQLVGRGRVSCVLVYDWLEAEAPPPGRYRVSDGQRVRAISTTQDWQRGHIDGFHGRRDELTDFCRPRGIELVALRTDDDLAQSLATSLGRKPSGPRRGRARR